MNHLNPKIKKGPFTAAEVGAQSLKPARPSFVISDVFAFGEFEFLTLTSA